MDIDIYRYMQAAFRKQAMLWHPDRPHNHSRTEEATTRFQSIRTAFDYLLKHLCLVDQSPQPPASN